MARQLPPHTRPNARDKPCTLLAVRAGVDRRKRAYLCSATAPETEKLATDRMTLLRCNATLLRVHSNDAGNVQVAHCSCTRPLRHGSTLARLSNLRHADQRPRARIGDSRSWPPLSAVRRAAQRGRGGQPCIPHAGRGDLVGHELVVRQPTSRRSTSGDALVSPVGVGRRVLSRRSLIRC